jgi:hypothetical protein
MPKKQLKEFIVPMKITYSENVIVEAKNAIEARSKADRGEFDNSSIDVVEILDYESTGPAELNE